MLPKEEREIIFKIGRYKYNKMKKLGLTYEEFLLYEKEKENEKELKKKIGYREYNEMKKLKLNYEDYKQYKKEQKFKKYEKKREKDKIRYKTIRHIQRYCNIEMKCQVCNTDKNVEIHHPNYNEYLKVNLLCNKHHNQLHNFELIPPSVIDLETIMIKKPVFKERKEYIESKIEDIKRDIVVEKYNYSLLCKKYGIDSGTIKRYLLKSTDSAVIMKQLEENTVKKMITNKNHNKNNPFLDYKIEHNVTTRNLSKILDIPISTLRAIECGKTNVKNVRPKTKQKLKKFFTTRQTE